MTYQNSLYTPDGQCTQAIQIPLKGTTVLGAWREMYESMLLSDVTVVVEKRTFRAHKVVLTSRSQVFAAMFQRDMKESRLNRVEIDDIETHVFEAMLRFIYTDEMPEDMNVDMAKSLLGAADKYLVTLLRGQCLKYLVEHTSIENCLELYGLANVHSDDYFRVHTFRYIQQHLSQVTVSKAWIGFKKENRSFLLDMIEDVFQPDSNK